MRIVNVDEIEELAWETEGGKHRGAGKEISEALGRDPASTDLMQRHPFDVEILRVAPGATPYSYHAHSAQWEFYHVISGNGRVRHEGGWERIRAGDAFVFRPGEAHQLENDGSEDLVVYVVADNPIGEAWYYPDSATWSVPIPRRTIVRTGVTE